MKSGTDNSPRAQQFRRTVVRTSRFDWVVVVFLLLIQQGAFVSMPLIMADTNVALREVENPFNTASLLTSMVLLLIVCIPQYRRISILASGNFSVVLYTIIVLMSVSWSIHPDVSLRRGVAYVVTMFVVFYLCVKFSVDDRMKALSWSFAISAVGSLLFVAAFTRYGIMEGMDDTGDLNGNWRGIFPHKNVLGFVMAAGVFTELYLIAGCNSRRIWRFGAIAIYLGLIVLSRSTTALLISLLYVALACIYAIWTRSKLVSYVISVLCASVLLVVLISLWIQPDVVLGLLGKDPTLTGRTGLWSAVIGLIEQRPWLGWGYRAMWQVDDATTVKVDDMTGNWGVPSAHNAVLEITLELGLFGLVALLAIIGIAISRGVRCCKAGALPLGWFSLMFFVGAILAGQTIETLGLNQVIEWVMFNMLSFSCQQSLATKSGNWTAR